MKEESVFSHLTIADKILIVVLLLVSVFSYAMVKSGFTAGAYASVSVDNKETFGGITGFNVAVLALCCIANVEVNT